MRFLLSKSAEVGGQHVQRRVVVGGAALHVGVWFDRLRIVYIALISARRDRSVGRGYCAEVETHDVIGDLRLLQIR